MYLGYVVLFFGVIILDFTPVDSVTQELINWIFLNPFRAKRDEIFKKHLKARLTKSNYIVGRTMEHKPSAVYLPFQRRKGFYQTHNQEVPSMVFDFANTEQNDIILYDHTFSMQEKRSQEALSKENATYILSSQGKPKRYYCGSCEQGVGIVNFGPEHYPSYALNKTCNMKPNSCKDRNFNCQPEIYYISVLKKRDLNDSPFGTKSLPPQLSENYTFVKKLIVTGCHCTLI